MASWTLVYHPTIRRDLARLPRADRQHIDRVLAALTNDPFPPAHRHLAHHPVADFRLRVGRYRVLYDVDREHRLVVILMIAKRDEQTYR